MVLAGPQDVKCTELRVRLWICGSLGLLEKRWVRLVQCNVQEGVDGEGADKGV